MIETIRKALLPIIEDKGCHLYDLVYEQEKGENYLRVFIEKNDGTLDMDTCVAVSELVSEKLDEIDVIKDEYYLEVSSPGVEREIRSLDEAKQAVGEYVYIELHNAVKGVSEAEGTLLSVEESTLTIRHFVKGVKKTLVTDYDNVSFLRYAVKF